MKSVEFIKKQITIKDEKNRDQKMYEFFKEPGGHIYNVGEVTTVTDRHAEWLVTHGFATIKEEKEDKKAAKRETK